MKRLPEDVGLLRCGCVDLEALAVLDPACVPRILPAVVVQWNGCFMRESRSDSYSRVKVLFGVPTLTPVDHVKSTS